MYKPQYGCRIEGRLTEEQHRLLLLIAYRYEASGAEVLRMALEELARSLNIAFTAEKELWKGWRTP